MGSEEEERLTRDGEQDVIPQTILIQLIQQPEIPIHNGINRRRDSVPKRLAHIIDTEPNSSQNIINAGIPRRRAAGKISSEQRLDLVVEVILRVGVDDVLVCRGARDG